MHAAIADKREELAELCRQYDVARLEVFGSAARATETLTFSSSSIQTARCALSTGISIS